MKKFTKILSVVLVLVMALSVMIIPTSAATPEITAEVVAEYAGQTSGGYDYYKFSVYIDSTLSLSGFQCNITWDNSVFTALNATRLTDMSGKFTNAVMNRTDTENVLYKYTEAYEEYGYDNGGYWESDLIQGETGDYGEYTAYLPADAAAPSVAVISDTNMGTTLVDAGYTGAYMAWANVFTDNYLNVSGGSTNNYISPVSGRVMVMSWYMRLNDGVEAGNYEVGFLADQAKRLTGTYLENDGLTSLDEGTLVSIQPDQVAYTNAVVTVADAAPELSISHFKDQVRYNDDSFDYRTVYKIDNFDEIFADLNDGSDRIIDAGFVFSTEEAIDVDAAKEQVESWKATADGNNITFDVMNYSAATRCYISTTFTGADYAFACLVKDIPNSVGEGEDANLSALGYIIYEDAEGNTAYAYYDYTLEVDALYKQYK